MADLVAQHGRELGLRLHQGHEAARHVDEPAGQRERVRCRVVDHAEAPGQLGPLRARGERRADAADVGLQPRIFDQADARLDLLRGLLPHLDLLPLGDERQLALPGDRVRGASAGRRRERGHQQPRSDVSKTHGCPFRSM